MSEPSAYALYGLVIRSELPLAAPVAPAAAGGDLTVRLGEELPGGAAPPVGEIWAQVDFGHGQVTQLTRTPAGWSLHYATAGEFRLAGDLRSATAHPLPESSSGRTSALPGSVLSWWLNLRGEPVLHASAVAIGGEAIAFLGASGMGKSTLATLLCSAGARLVTDDVLRLRRLPDGFACHPGTGELRLRPNAAPLSALFPADQANRSTDGRTTVRFASAPAGLPRLRAIFLPRPNRELRELRVEPLSPVQASFHLNGYPRVLGWRVDEPRRRQFELFAALAQAVPVCQLHVPWGPPFDTSLPNTILAAAKLSLPTP